MKPFKINLHKYSDRLSLKIEDFPIYSLFIISNKDSEGNLNILVGGGGGPSKSGIRNGLLRLTMPESSFLCNSARSKGVEDMYVLTEGEFLPTEDTVLSIWYSKRLAIGIGNCVGIMEERFDPLEGFKEGDRMVQKKISDVSTQECYIVSKLLDLCVESD